MANSNFSAEYSPKELTKVVDAIYDCAIFPDRWHGVIHMLAELCASPLSFLATHDYATQRSYLTFTLGYTDTFISSYQSEYAMLDPLFEPIRAAPPGVVETRSMLIDDQDYYSSRYYREWAKPQGLGDCILINILQTEECFAWWGCHRHEVAPRYQERDIGLLASFAPDLCRSVKICAAFKKQRSSRGRSRSEYRRPRLQRLSRGPEPPRDLHESFGRAADKGETGASNRERPPRL